MERLLLTNLTTTTESYELQFAYTPRRCTTDAVLCLTNELIMYIDKKQETMCAVYPFSSAFNTLASGDLITGMMEKGGDPHVID